MVIKSIRLKNFRQYQDTTIEFSTDKERNVTVVMGDNGTGKTTLAQAFQWVLYENASLKMSDLMNRITKRELEEGEKAEVMVVLEIIYNGTEYTITRKRTYEKTGKEKLRDIGSAAFQITHIDEDGKLFYESERRRDYMIRQFLPKDLSRFFFFDGERIEEMSKEIQSGKSKDFKEAVYSLMGLRATQNAMKHLNGGKNSVVSYYNAAIEKNNSSAQKMREYNIAIERLEHQIETESKSLENKQEKLKQCEADIEECERIVYEETPQMKLKAQYQHLLKEVESLSRQKEGQTEDLLREFSKGLHTFCMKPLVNMVRPSFVPEESTKNDRIPDVTHRMIKYLIEKRGRCLCGAHIEPGTEVYRELTGLLEQALVQPADTLVSQYQRDADQMENRSDDFLKTVHKKIDRIDDIVANIHGKEQEAQEKSEYIGNTRNGENAKARKRQLQEEAKILSENIGALDTQIRQAKTSLQRQETEKGKLVVVDESTRRNARYLAYAQRLYDGLYKDYSEKEISYRNRLQQRMNEIFQAIYDGDIQIELDDKYRIKVSIRQEHILEDEVEKNTAQGYALIFAFISAIIDLAKEKINEKALEDSDLIDTTEEGYPIVMDAPLSAFDKTRIKSICTEIPRIADQVIIFIKDTDGDIAEEHMEAKIGKRYLIRQVDGSKLHSEVIGR